MKSKMIDAKPDIQDYDINPMEGSEAESVGYDTDEQLRDFSHFPDKEPLGNLDDDNASEDDPDPEEDELNAINHLPVEDKTKKVAKKGKKTFGLPLDHPSFETFIDHSTTLDDKGYPLLPNGKTVFVRHPGQKFTNWGTFGFTYKTSGGGVQKKRPEWRTVRFNCLGVVICCKEDCDYLGSPPTAPGKIDQMKETPVKCPAALCSEYLRHVPCEDTICRMDEHRPTGWGIIRHAGYHVHPWPRRGKPDKLSISKLGDRVVNNPLVGPLQHKVGRAPAGKQEIKTASGIHPAFGNLHQTGYYRRKLLVDAGVIPEKKIPGSGNSFLLDMIHWAKMISSSFLPENTHMTFQTPWMAEQFLAREEDGSVYSGGLLSDVTYKFFANGYLMTTSMYHNVIHRWIPMQLTWRYGLSEEHYVAHFTTLMNQIKEAQLLPDERDILVRQVVNFSVAQQNGFIRAYMAVFDVTDRAQVLGKLRGCQEHFRAQVTRVRRNLNIIPRHQQGKFQRLTEALLEKDVPGKDTYEQNMATLRRLFPRAKRWLDWWQVSDTEAMLFRSRQKQIDDDGLCDDLPETTNAQESMHRVYYMIFEGQCTVQVGLVQLYALVSSLQRDHTDLLRGVAIEYGSTKNYQKVAETLGWSKKNRNRKDKHNDGRAPDTTNALLGTKGSKGSKKLGRPVGSVNIDWNPVTTFQGFYVSNTAGCQNRCWLDAIVECLHALHTPLWFHGSKAASASFPTDQFASADTFFELIFDPRDKAVAVPGPTRTLFRLNRLRKLVCSRDASHRLNKTVPTNTINLCPQDFENQFTYAQTPELLAQWASAAGIRGLSNRHCQLCKKSDKRPPPFVERTQISFEPNTPPPHLYVHLELSSFLVSESRISDMVKMQDECLLPYGLKLYGISYFMRARGFWSGGHFWCQVVRTVGGLAGVWYHNDLENQGNATLISRELESIGGACPKTSWAMYSREPTADESVIIEAAKARITKSNPNPQAPGSEEDSDDYQAPMTQEEMDKILISETDEDEVPKKVMVGTDPQSQAPVEEELEGQGSAVLVLSDSPREKKGGVIHLPTVNVLQILIVFLAESSNARRRRGKVTLKSAKKGKGCDRCRKTCSRLVALTAEQKKPKGWKGWAIVEAETVQTDVAESQEGSDDGTVRKSKRRRG
ncbi:uncharacterized protein MELLADRAFT_89010 [Melampsora larici-populina 98AG31]|uniref:GCM domain-containing protein n=1 Tax=Melampsora larici-populina (strain 98AG31 / pathotype 3-4-7) TaxID=747676 RepID=F4R6N0_MELLP|nr:uncharacterized protein MELLADRAFT_89010 [Melampsora larici-populina 98AG31]EGG12431.1 hypothetical protein MELLADRAFT_89010 [Melampsora larici-populina 98AG31]